MCHGYIGFRRGRAGRKRGAVTDRDLRGGGLGLIPCAGIRAGQKETVNAVLKLDLPCEQHRGQLDVLQRFLVSRDFGEQFGELYGNIGVQRRPHPNRGGGALLASVLGRRQAEDDTDGRGFLVCVVRYHQIRHDGGGRDLLR